MPHSPPWSPLGVLKVGSCSGTGFSLCRGRWQIPLWWLFSHWQGFWQVPVGSWEAAHVTHDMRPSLKCEQWRQASCSEELRALNAATKEHVGPGEGFRSPRPCFFASSQYWLSGTKSRYSDSRNHPDPLWILSFFSFFLFLTKYSWFTILCWLLLYSKVIHLYILFLYFFPLWFLTGY